MELTPQNIKDLRKKMGLSQTEFGRLVGVSWVTVLRWERGKTVPTSEAHIRALNALNNWHLRKRAAAGQSL